MRTSGGGDCHAGAAATGAGGSDAGKRAVEGGIFMVNELTADAVRTMSAGREMDAIVAERVMGWAWFPWRPDWHKEVGEECYKPARRDGMVLRNLMPGGGEPPGPWCGPPPQFSTDIAVAWPVVEAIRTRPPEGTFDYGPWLSIEARTVGEGSPSWTVAWKYGIQWEGEQYHDWCATGETAPLAICRLALLTTIRSAAAV